MTHLLRITTGLAAVAVLALAQGCGRDLCARAESASKSVERAAASCENFEPEENDFEGESCQENLRNCTAEDEAKLEAMFECMERLEPCVPDEEMAFAMRVIGCLGHAGGLSDGCGGE